MAFNPFITFQRNKRFWMAAILMVCMISFVFCTGMKGDMSEKIPQWFGFGRGSTAVFEVAGRSYSRKDLDDLKTQRNIANAYMKHCADTAYKNVQKELFNLSKDTKDDKDQDQKEQYMVELSKVAMAIAQRKKNPRYFDGDVKFNDLVEFKFWQAEADRLGIRIEEDHLKALFTMEFFGKLSREDLFYAENQARSELRDASQEFIRKSIAEEYRVKIAQYAVFGAQPYSFFARAKEGALLSPKFSDADMPDQMRAPMTLAQLWDFHKAKRGNFTVKLVPMFVEDFAKGIREPELPEKLVFFNTNKNNPYDPSSKDWGLETPNRIKIEFVMADPKSPEYFNQALAATFFEVFPPLGVHPMHSASPALVYATHMGNAQANKLVQWRQYKSLNPANYQTTAFDAPGSVTWFTKKHGEEAATVVGMASLNGYGALALFQELNKPKDAAADKLIAQAEWKRRIPLLAGIMPPAIPSSTGYDVVFPLLAMNPLALANELDTYGESKAFPRLKVKDLRESMEKTLGRPATKEEMAAKLDLTVDEFEKLPADATAAKYWHIPLEEQDGRFFQRATLPVEAVQVSFQEMGARRMAETWAQANLLAAEIELRKAKDDAAKYRRELKTLVPKLNLTYGPPDDQKGNYYDRFTIGEAKEFQPLKDAYLEYIHQINLFEGRVTPDRKLTPDDFYKLFFTNEPFAAAAKFQAKPWPPEVKSGQDRDAHFADLRFNKDIQPDDLKRFAKHFKDSDPTQPVPTLHMYKTAPRPILFWRTAEIPANRPTDYSKVVKDLNAMDELRDLRVGIAMLESLGVVFGIEGSAAGLKEREAKLRDNEVELAKVEADFRFIENQVVKGWKYERARGTNEKFDPKDSKVLPRAKEFAKKLIEAQGDAGKLIDAEARSLNQESIVLNLSEMQQDAVGHTNRYDYFAPTLPKDKLIYPNDKTVEQLLSLYDLKKPIEIGHKELDEINKELFEQAKKANHPERFVQIIANKPRTVFYIAAITDKAKEEEMKGPFRIAMAFASYPDGVFPMRDLFVDRAQKAQAEQYRADFIAGLRVAHNFSMAADGAKAAASFDGERGSD